MGAAVIATLLSLSTPLPRDAHSDALIEIGDKIGKAVDRTVENSEDAVKLDARKR